MGEIGILRNICQKMSDLLTGVRLIIAGTGCDLISKDASSVSSAVKHRMRPWTEDHFRSAVSPLATGIVDNAKALQGLTDAIIQHPVLSKLTTNARAVLFVVQQACGFWHRSEGSNNALRGLTGTLAKLVIEDYISANGLSELTFAEQRIMAYFVFLELHESSIYHGVARFPAFDGLMLHVAIKLKKSSGKPWASLMSVLKQKQGHWVFWKAGGGRFLSLQH